MKDINTEQQKQDLRDGKLFKLLTGWEIGGIVLDLAIAVGGIMNMNFVGMLLGAYMAANDLRHFMQEMKLQVLMQDKENDN